MNKNTLEYHKPDPNAPRSNRAQRRASFKLRRSNEKKRQFKEFIRILRTPKFISKLSLHQLLYARKVLISRKPRVKCLFKIVDEQIILKKKEEVKNVHSKQANGNSGITQVETELREPLSTDSRPQLDNNSVVQKPEA